MEQAPLGLTFLTLSQTIRHWASEAYCKFPPEVSGVCNISQEPWNFPGRDKSYVSREKNTVRGGLSQCTWHCRTTAAWARVKLRVIHPFWTCSEIPGIWNHQLDFFFSMDLCILLYSHFHQVIRLELLQQSFLSILLERLFENFTFLRNFQMVD